MENFKIESSYLKLSCEFRSFITCVKAFFNKPDYQKLLMYKRFGQAFVRKHAAEPLKRSAKLLRVQEKTKSSAESLKRLSECLYSNTAHAVPISLDTIKRAPYRTDISLRRTVTPCTDESIVKSYKKFSIKRTFIKRRVIKQTHFLWIKCKFCPKQLSVKREQD